MTAEIDLICADRSDGACGANRRVALHQDHARHVARQEVPVIWFGGSGTSLCGNEAEALELAGELAEGFGLIARKNERRFDRLESGAGGQASPRGCVLGERGLLSTSRRGLSLRLNILGGHLRLGMNDVLDWGNAANGFLGENAQLQGESARKLAFEIDRAAAHPSDNAGVFNFWTLELDENDGLSGSKEIGHDADDFQIELFNLIARKDGVGVALHAWANLAKWDDFRGGGSLSLCREERRCDGRSESKRH